MIITTIKLQPFGSFSNKDLAFQPGLNVILGPNEAGKSTLFNAIQKVLLVPTHLYRKDYEREILGYLPIGGGDTVHIELTFEREKKAYVLKKTWGGTKTSHVQLPDGSVLTSDDAVTQQIETLLPAKSGTVRWVLMTYQSGLQKTLADLQEEEETIRSLGDMLRKAVLATDGISIEKFLAKIEAMQAGYFSRWDHQKKYPEGGRGIENPWKKEKGLILETFYEKERLRVQYEAAAAYEKELDALNRSIGNLDNSIAERKHYKQTNSKIVEDVKKRRTVEAEAKVATAEINELKQANTAWPVLEKEVENLQKLLPGLKEKVQTLFVEKDATEKAEKSKNLRERYGRAKGKKDAVATAEKELAKCKKIDREDLDLIRKVAQGIDMVRASLSAGKLVVTMKPKKNIVLSVQSDLGQMAERTLEAGKDSTAEASGRVIVEYADLRLEVASGEGDFEETQKKYTQAVQELSRVLAQYQVESLEQAAATHNEYEARLANVRKACAIFEEEVQGTSFEELETQVRDIGDTKETRSLVIIIPELMKAQNEIERKEQDIVSKQEILDDYIAKYKSKDNLLDELLKVKHKELEIKKEMGSLAPLPPEVTDVGAYLAKFEENLSALVGEEEQLKAKKLEQAVKLEQAPDESSEELKVRFEDSKKQFEGTMKKGEAIVRIGAVAGTILGDDGADIYQELEEDLAHFAEVISDKKYSKVRMDQSMPVGFIRSDGNVVTYDRLSFGTKDMLCLALRLAIAKHFLAGSSGFLVMDDPLVNMDPARQEKAAELMKEYASNKQVLIFTCHPRHAELLGGNQIKL
jgi:exonuclease SbcC